MLREKVIRLAKTFIYEALKNKIFYNVKKRRYPKNALLCYVNHPLLLNDFWGKRILNVTNYERLILLIDAIDELGFNVDVASSKIEKTIDCSKYDLIIISGPVNVKKVFKSVKKNCVKIYFSGGSYWAVQNKDCILRYCDFTKDTGIIIAPERISSPEEQNAIEFSELIILIGNQVTKETYPNEKHVIPIYNFGFLRQPTLLEKYGTDFLFFAGGGNIFKGLDLLLDAFKSLDKSRLHVCQRIDDKFLFFVNKYGYDKNKNIIFHGFINKYKKSFLDIVSSCSFVILPTCSEGTAQSVLDCMALGLIPIITRRCGIDIEYPIIEIENLSVKAILESIKKSLRMSNVELYKRRLATIDLIKNKYSVNNFKKRLYDAIKTALEKKIICEN